MKKSEIKPAPLVGRYFHIFDDNCEVQYQGQVLSQIDETHYLIQLYEWFVGNPDTIYVVSIDTMVSKTLSRDARNWQFYENREHWIGWYEDHPRRSKTEPKE